MTAQATVTAAFISRCAAEMYSFRVAYSPDDEVFVARCAEMPLLAAHGDNPFSALREIVTVVDGCLSHMRQSGERIPLPGQAPPQPEDVTRALLKAYREALASSPWAVQDLHVAIAAYRAVHGEPP